MGSNVTATAGQELTNLAMESLNRARIDPQTAGTMSRRRLLQNLSDTSSLASATISAAAEASEECKI